MLKQCDNVPLEQNENVPYDIIGSLEVVNYEVDIKDEQEGKRKA